MDQGADMAQEAVGDTRKVVDRLYRTGKETRDELQKGIEAVKEDMQKSMEDIKDEVRKLAGVAAAVATNIGGALMEHQGPGAAHTVYTQRR